MNKKVYFICAPVFLHWPVQIAKRINELNSNNIISGGFIGGAKKYHKLLEEEFGNLADQVVYTHDLEKKWLEGKYQQDDLAFFKTLLGDKILNQLIIADRHLGNGYLAGGGIASSKFLDVLKKDKQAHLNYVIGMLKYLHEFLSKNKPDVIYSYAVAGAFTLAIAEMSKNLGITFAKLTHTRIGNKVVIDTSPRDEMDLVKLKFLEPSECLSRSSIEFGKRHLKEFREKQLQPEYQILQNNIYLTKTKIKYQLKLWAKFIKGYLDRSSEHFHTSYLGNIKYEQKVVKEIKKYWRNKPFFEAEKLIEEPFFFYPLHVDPEASTMVISPSQTNQLSTLEAVAKAKPIGYILIVKEHLTMIGRRPKGFYEKINSLPGVYMVNPIEPSFKFINSCKAVITLTGTAGLEAILLKKPAIFLGNFIYKFIEQGFVCTNDLSSLAETLCSIDNIKAVDDKVLIKLLAAINEVSFPFNGGLIWSGISKKRVIDNPDIVENFAVAINNLIKE